MAPPSARLTQLQRAVRVSAPTLPPVRRYRSRAEMSDPAEAALRELESQAYLEQCAVYEKLRDGLMAVVSTWKATFLYALDLAVDLPPRLAEPWWVSLTGTTPMHVPRAVDPVTSAITRTGPPALPTSAIPGATA